MMGPLDLTASVGHGGVLVVSLVIGFLFGFILEAAGFGDSRKLAGQFYFTDLTVLKVMFTSIIVAAVLIGLASSLGLLNLDGIFVNPTHLGPGIIGGVVMGVGFIVGGYCPGTSLVSMATGKIDGMFFVLGVSIGIFAFGESVGSLGEWWLTSGDLGRFTLPELFGLSYGVTLLLVVLMALAMFAGFSALRTALYKPKESSNMRLQGAGALALVGAAVLTIILGQPTLDQKYEHMSAKYQKTLKERAVHLDPAELLGLMNDNLVALRIFDSRKESDWNVFHLRGAERVDLDTIASQKERIKAMPANGVIVVVDNDETQALVGWKRLIALGATNVYLLEGGLNNWLMAYGKASEHGHGHGSTQAGEAGPKKLKTVPKGALGFSFALALGQHHPASNPDPHHVPKRAFTKKVKLISKKTLSGGCG
ncbi:MAG: YeeE/YedE family protein [Deltaproteobacteria bacterium]|nr:YeeE/YedE family protein [Deltaproteobacteria bacterium]